MNNIRFLIKLIVGLMILYFLVKKLPGEEIFISLSAISYKWYLTGIGIFILFYMLKCLRWCLLVERMGIRVLLKDLFLIYFKGVFMGIITPGRLGELGRAWFLKGGRDSKYKGIASVLIDRIFDVGVIILFAFGGVFYYGNIFSEEFTKIFWLLFLGLMCLVVGIAISYNHNGLKSSISSLLSKFLGSKIRNKVKMFSEGFSMLQMKDIALVLGLSIGAQLMWGVVGYIFSLSLGFKISYWWILWCMSVVAILSNLPVSHLGIGVREAAFAFLFVANGYLSVQGFNFGFLITSLWLWVGLFGFVIWFIDRKSEHTKSQEFDKETLLC